MKSRTELLIFNTVCSYAEYGTSSHQIKWQFNNDHIFFPIDEKLELSAFERGILRNSIAAKFGIGQDAVTIMSNEVLVSVNALRSSNLLRKLIKALGGATCVEALANSNPSAEAKEAGTKSLSVPDAELLSLSELTTALDIFNALSAAKPAAPLKLGVSIAEHKSTLYSIKEEKPSLWDRLATYCCGSTEDDNVHSYKKF